ncbi:MAG: PAS domain-containing sensor histidine kinase [Bacteroidales bacterium]|nr:PAS domain-containing sensor histidine kinase [Bacteroidales bacterium]
MKNLINKINTFSLQFNAFAGHWAGGKVPDELIALKDLLAGINQDANAIINKQSGGTENFDSLIDLLNEIVFEVDINGNFTFMNDYGIQKLELNKAELQQGRLNMSAVVHPHDVEKARASILNNRFGKRTSGIEYRLVTASGKEIIVQIFNSPIVVNNVMMGLRGLAVDISNRKKIETDLHNSVEKYKGIFNNSPLAIGYYTRNGILTDCNEKFAMMLGSSREVLQGFNIFRDLKNEGILTAMRDSLEKGTGTFEGVYQAVLTQRKAPARVLFQGIRDENGNIFGGVALAEDISQRVQAENALKASEAKFRALVENIGEGAGITDVNNTFLFSNPMANKIFGVENEGLTGRSLIDFMTKGEFERVIIETNKRKKGLKSSYEIEIVRPDGQTRDLLVTATPNDNEKGEYISTLGIFRDITERKKIERDLKNAHKTLLINNRELKLAKEKAEESDRLKSAFLATMNHELRTPLNHIIGLSELIDSSMPSGEIEDFAGQINQSGINLLSLINDIFQTIELEMGDAKPLYLKLDLKEFFSKVLKDAIQHRANLKKTHINIFFDLPPLNTEPYFTTDKSMLKKVFDNLIHNAIKFTNDGEIRFGIINADSSQFTFFVKDTGIGIPHEKQQLIFERFRQVDERLKREYGGTGLGLYYSKKIVELLNGKIWFDSVEGIGSTFFFSLSSTEF